MRAEEEYVPERDEEEEKDADEVLGELEQDKTEAEEAEEEQAERETEIVVGELVRRAAVVEIVRDLLAQQPVDAARRDALTEQEREALQFLEAVIDGRTRGGEFIYAERRLEQLNLVLADLQPLLSVGAVEGLEDTLEQVVDGFAQLRHELQLLEEAQEEVFHAPEEKKKEDEDDDDDKPDDDAAEAGEPGERDAAAKPKSSLTDEPAPAAGAADGKADEKKPGLWGRLWSRGKKDEGGGA